MAETPMITAKRMRDSMKKLLTLLLLAALCIGAACTGASADRAAYSSTQAFIDVLERAGQPYVLDGVDEYGAECLSIEHAGENHGYTAVVLFEDSLEAASIRVWYIIEYDPAQLMEVVRVCNALNAGNRFVSFYADESDNTVTASMDLIFRGEDAGAVTARAVDRLTDTLDRAWPQLLACTMPAVTAAPAPTATPATAVTVRPTAAPTATPAPTAAPQITPAPGNDVAGRTVVITADSARLRSAPTAAGGYVGTVHRGDSFLCFAEVNGWYAVEYRGRRAYVSMDKAGLE